MALVDDNDVMILRKATIVEDKNTYKLRMSGEVNNLALSNGVSTSISLSASQELKVGASVLTDRKLVTMQPLDGELWVSHSSPATSSNAFLKVFKNQYAELERSDTVSVYIAPVTGTVTTLIGEVG